MSAADKGMPGFSQIALWWVVIGVVLSRGFKPWVAVYSVAGSILLTGMSLGYRNVLRRGWVSINVVYGGLLLGFAWLVTHGTFDWHAEEGLGRAYDLLARSLREGSAEVDCATIRAEAWRVGGRCFMYFGPFPALLREVPLWLVPSSEGHLSRPSVLLALWATAGGVGMIASDASRRAGASSTRARGALASLLLAVFAGSPLFVMATLANIFHEAVIWAVCASSWAVRYGLRLLLEEKPAMSDLFWLSAAVGVAMLSRVTFVVATGGLLALGVVRIASQFGLRAWSLCAVGLLPALAAVVFQAWCNLVRFGSVGQFADFAAYVGAKPVGAPFDVDRIYHNVVVYFGIHAAQLAQTFPYVRFALFDQTGTASMGARSQPVALIAPLLLTSFWFLVSAGLACGAVWRHPRCRWLCLALGMCVLQVAAMLSYYWLSYRYTAECVPTMLLLAALFLSEPCVSSTRWRVWKVAVWFSVISTVSSGFHFQYASSAFPGWHRARVSHALERIRGFVGEGMLQ